MKDIYVWHKEVWGKNKIKQSAVKMTRTEIDKAWYELFNQGLKYAKEIEDKHSWKSSKYEQQEKKETRLW